MYGLDEEKLLRKLIEEKNGRNLERSISVRSPFPQRQLVTER